MTLMDEANLAAKRMGLQLQTVLDSVDSLIYMVHERGDLTCLNARDGKVIWNTKLKDQFNASALYASGNILDENVELLNEFPLAGVGLSKIILRDPKIAVEKYKTIVGILESKSNS